MHMYAPYSRLKFGLATTAIHTRVQRLVTEHMQVPFSVTQGRYQSRYRRLAAWRRTNKVGTPPVSEARSTKRQAKD